MITESRYFIEGHEYSLEQLRIFIELDTVTYFSTKVPRGNTLFYEYHYQWKAT